MASKINNRYYIYRLYWPNGETDYCYIGSSQTKYYRYSTHKNNLVYNKHINKGMQEIYNSCGVLPDIEILEYLDMYEVNIVKRREQIHLKKYWPKCFNTIIPDYGNSDPIFAHHFKERRKIREGKERKL